jgi:predicted DNA-binding ribbon-helix-helix protein
MSLEKGTTVVSTGPGQPAKSGSRGASTLVNRNVFIAGRRTSLRLEPAMWDGLAEICRRENMTIHELCGLIDQRRRASSLTAAIRVFIMTYFRAAATEEGHASNGHGTLYESARGGQKNPGSRRRKPQIPCGV